MSVLALFLTLFTAQGNDHDEINIESSDDIKYINENLEDFNEEELRKIVVQLIEEKNAIMLPAPREGGDDNGATCY